MTMNMERVLEIESGMGKGARKPTDMNAPKRPMSAYMYWTLEARPALQKAHPDWSNAQCFRQLGKDWKKVGKADRAPFQAKYEKAKATYDKKLATYKKTGNYKKFQMEKLAWRIHETKKPFRTDPDAPKGATTAYRLYSASVRKEIVSANPGLGAAAVMKEQAVWWKALSEEERAPWIAKAGKINAKHQKMLEKYHKTREYQTYMAEKEAYKARQKALRNKLLGIKKKRARSTGGAKKAKKAKRSSSRRRSSSKRRSASRTPKRRTRRRARTPRSSKSRSASRRHSSSRKARTPKSAKRRSARRRVVRRARVPKAPKARRRSSTSRSASRRSASRRRARTPRSSKGRSASRRRTTSSKGRKARTPKGPRRRKSTSRKRSSSRRSSKKKRVARRARKAKKKIVYGSMRRVWSGTADRTKGGLTKKDLMENKAGKVVSKKRFKRGQEQFKASGLGKWTAAVMKAREEMGVTGFMAVKKGTPLYDLAKKYYGEE